MTTRTQARPATPSIESSPAGSVTAAISEFTRTIVMLVADAAYERHRLKYIWKDGDTPDSHGDPTTLFVCICEEAFDRRGFNHHIYDKLVEVA